MTSTFKLEGVDTSNFTILTGQDNFSSWLRDITSVAYTKNLWDLLNGTEDVLKKPTRPVRPNFSKLIITRSKDSDSDAQNAQKTAIDQLTSDYNFEVTEYKMDLAEWEKQDTRVRQAKGLLLSTIHSAIRCQVADSKSPSEALTEVKALCQMTDAQALTFLYTKINQLSFGDKTTVSDFINKLRQYQKDIQDLKGEYSDEQIISKILISLPEKYKDFKHYWSILAGTAAMPSTVKDLWSRLLGFEATLKDKSQEKGNKKEKGNKENKDNKDGQKDKPRKKCSGCNKWGTHEEKDCWVAHPEKRPSQDSDTRNKQVNHVATTPNAPTATEPPKTTTIKPNKVVIAVEVNRYEYLRRCMDECDEAFSGEDLDRVLQLAINVPLPDTDDTDLLPQAAQHAPQTNHFSDNSGCGSVPTYVDNHTLVSRSLPHQEIPLSPSSLRDAFIQVPFDEEEVVPMNGLHKHAFSYNSHILGESEHSPRSWESAMRDELAPLEEYRSDLEAQEQLQRELHYSTTDVSSTSEVYHVPGGYPDHESTGTSVSSLPPTPYADINTQTSALSFEKSGVGGVGFVIKLPRALMMIKDMEVDSDRWILDSGANICIVNDKKWFTHYRSFSYPIGTANVEDTLHIEGNGTVSLSVSTGQGDESIQFEIHHVAYAPAARCNIVSVSWITEKALLRGIFDADSAIIMTREGAQIAYAPQINGLYVLQVSPSEEPSQEHQGKAPVLMLTQEGEADNDELNDDTLHDDHAPSTNEDDLEEQDEHESQQQADDSTNDHVSDSEDDTPSQVPGGVVPPLVAPEIDFNDPVWKWHRRLGHVGLHALIKLLKLSDGIDLTEKQIKARIGMICPVCATTKATNNIPRDPATRRATEIGALIHVDAWGSYPIRAYDGTQYMLCFTDDKTRYTWFIRYANKHQIPEKFQALHRRIERKYGIQIRAYRFDNEFPSFGELSRWLEKKGVNTEPAIPYRHHMNGVAERAFRTVREGSSSMMLEANIAGQISKILELRTAETLRTTTIPEDLWVEAFELAVWHKNRSPARALQMKKTPWEALTGYKPNLEVEKIFGSRVYVTVPPEFRRKSLLLPRGTLGYFVNFESESVMRVYDADLKKINRVTAARVNDGIGLNDPQDGQSLQDRIDGEEQAGDQSPSDHHDDELLSEIQSPPAIDQETTAPVPSRVDDDELIDLYSSNDEFEDPFSDSDDEEQNLQSNVQPRPSLTTSEPAPPEILEDDAEPVTIPSHVSPVHDEDHADGDDVFSDMEEAPPAPLKPAKLPRKQTGKKSKYFAHMADTLPRKGKAAVFEGGPKTWCTTRMAIALDLLYRSELFDGDRRRQIQLFTRLYPDTGKTADRIQAFSYRLSKFDRPKMLSYYPSFYDEELRQEVQQNIDTEYSRGDFVQPTGKSSKREYTNDEVAAIHLLQKSGKYNVSASHLLFLDIFKDLHTEAGAPKFDAFRSLYKNIANGSKAVPATYDAERLSQAIADSDALAPFEPDTTGPVRTLSHKKCVNCKTPGDNRVCNEKPCKRCVRQGVACTIWIDERVTISYYAEDNKPAYFHGEPECCYTCDTRQEGGSVLHGDGEFPCNECIRYSITYDPPARCKKPTADGGLMCYTFIDDPERRKQSVWRKRAKASTTADEIRGMIDSDDEESPDDSDEEDAVDQDLLQPHSEVSHESHHDDEDDNDNDNDRHAGTKRKLQAYRYSQDTVKKYSSRKDDPDDDHPGTQGVVGNGMAKLQAFRYDPGAASSSKASDSHANTTPGKSRPFKPTCLHVAAASRYGPEPQTRQQALAQRDKDQWIDAMDDEYNSLIQNQTWDVVDAPHDRKILGSRWVFKRKLGPDGSITKHKARFVVQGFSQVQGLDFDETFASVVKAPSYRLLFALQAKYGWKCHQMDVKTAFLHGEVEHTIYVRPPPGYPEAHGKVLKLNKSLYGLKQSPRQWYSKLRSFLHDQGWITSTYDSSIFMINGVIVDVYVDDLKIFSDSDELILATKKMLSDNFPMTDLGPCSFYLGMHVVQNLDGSIHLHQAAYVQQILERFNMQDVHPRHTPMRTDTKLEKHTGARKSSQFIQEYQSKVGSLNYAMCVTRPDIAGPVGVVSRYNSNPNDEHMAAVNDIFAYLKATPEFGPLYKPGGSDLHAFVDADWAGCRDTHRSTTGYVLMLSDGPISWASKRQKTVAQSTCEAEYIAGFKAAQELLWMQNLINNLGVPDVMTLDTPLYIDNQAALKLSRNPQYHDRTKHIAIKYHFLREATIAGRIDPTYVASRDNLADVLTKATPRETFTRLTTGMGLTSQCRH
ncbi:hypothetical protein KCV07_g10138, partial [Aureobasidium melanogenum]